MQLRIAWGGGVDRIWHGSIRLSHGKFSELAPLGVEANEPGSIWLERDAVVIQQRSLRAYDGLDVLVTAELDAHLVVSLADDAADVAQNVEIPLADLVSQSHNSKLDLADNRLLVTRAPGDRLRVHIQRDNLVFAPGESFTFDLSAQLVEGTQAGYRYSAAIAANPSGQRVWTEEYEAGADGTATSITIRVPEFEGVFDLSMAAIPAQLRARLYPKKPLAERKIQFVVLDKRAAPEAADGPLSRVVEINPMNPRWWERLGTLPLVRGLRKGPLGNGEAAPWEHPTLGPMIQLGPGGSAPNISWEAYPLPISKPGSAHVLEIEYPSDVPQAMGISLIEPNAAGAVMPIGLDSGVYVSDEDAENPPQLAKHRVVFWPRTKTPLLLITNRRQGSRAVYGQDHGAGAPHMRSSPGLPLAETEAGHDAGAGLCRHTAARAAVGRLSRPAAVRREFFRARGPRRQQPSQPRRLEHVLSGRRAPGEVSQARGLQRADDVGLCRRQHDLSQPPARADAALRHGRVLWHRAGSAAQGRARAAVSACSIAKA